MKKFFIDTNVWLRFFLADNKRQFEDCKKFLTLNEQGRFKIYTSTVVLLEIAFTLKSFYHIRKKQIISDLETLLAARNLTLIEKTSFIKALALFKRHQIKLADCLIASQLPKDVTICTYDREFKKIKDLISLTPKEIIAKNA